MAVLESTELLQDAKALQKSSNEVFPSDDQVGSDDVSKQVSVAYFSLMSLHTNVDSI